jgi:hypothetical protein
VLLSSLGNILDMPLLGTLDKLGRREGTKLGESLGMADFWSPRITPSSGTTVPSLEPPSSPVGPTVGYPEGKTLGPPEGFVVGTFEGIIVLGMSEGMLLGLELGLFEGCSLDQEGLVEGAELGRPDSVGEPEGVPVGL